jgi:hypothetical protein
MMGLYTGIRLCGTACEQLKLEEEPPTSSSTAPPAEASTADTGTAQAPCALPGRRAFVFADKRRVRDDAIMRPSLVY